MSNAALLCGASLPLLGSNHDPSPGIPHTGIETHEGCTQAAANIADLLAHPGALPPAQAGVSKRVAQPGGSVLFS
jgi:hypothetical protein